MRQNKTILVTGGAGYIGSHTCVELIQNGYQIVVLDNYLNSTKLALKRVEEITQTSLKIYPQDIRNKMALRQIFAQHNIDAIIHFAGLKAVGESVAKPLTYYDNNVGGSIILLKEAQKAGCKNLIFSSSATVYGTPEKLPITENCPTGNTTNPYGTSKFMIEEILQDTYQADQAWKIALLRYFNPVGAHASGKIGENPNGIPNNLMPFIAQVASGKLNHLEVFGNDYDTLDGTGIRDYIHVMDLAKGHVLALDYLLTKSKGEVLTVNLGTGKGYSVLQMVKAFAKASGKKIPYTIEDRRPGDIASCFADVNKAHKILNWHAELDIETMCSDAWRFIEKNSVKTS